MVLSGAVFVYYGLQLRYEEDLSKLLPVSESSEAGHVFGNLKVKDKIFMQMTGAEPEVLAEYVDELMDSIMTTDQGIANTLYRLEPDIALNALDFALMHVPTFVDTALYSRFDSAIAHTGETMVHNKELIMNDETGTSTQMVSTDPLNLRQYLMPDLSSGVGFTLVNDHLFCADSTVALIFISPDFQAFNSHDGRLLMKNLRHHVKMFNQAHPDVEVLMHGAVVRSGDNSRVMKRDIAITVGISMLIILIILCYSFKSFSMIWQNALPVIYGTFSAMACMYWVKGSMSLMSMGIASVVLGVAISYCLHVIVHQRFVGSIEQMLKEEALPVCLGCLTTIGAFVGLMFTQSDLLKDFGLFSTFALLGNTFFVLVFLPHFLSEQECKRNEKVFKYVQKINNYPYERNPYWVAVLSIFILVGIIFSPKVQFDNNLKNIGFESKNLHKSENLYAEKNHHGALQRHYAVLAPTLDEALDANNVLSDTLESLRRVGALTKYTPVVSVLFQSEKEQKRRIEAWKRYWTPEKVSEAMTAVREAAADNDLPTDIFEPFKGMVEGDYETGNLYESEILPEDLLCNFIEESGDKYLIFNSVQMNPEKKAEVDERIAGMSHTLVVDPFYYTGNMITLIRSDFNTALLISAIFVFVVLLFSFRDVFLALLAFMPMGLSWYVVQGWMAIFGLPFNLINIVISTFIFGIGVDYSIFVMQGLIAAHNNEGTRLLQYHKVAIFFSAVVLAVVMVTMLFAIHPAIKSIGICTIIGMASTIFITYTLQPLFFQWLMKVPFMQNKIIKK
jgi:predicted RND superfamily exporter protein